MAAVRGADLDWWFVATPHVAHTWGEIYDHFERYQLALRRVAPFPLSIAGVEVRSASMAAVSEVGEPDEARRILLCQRSASPTRRARPRVDGDFHS